MSKAIAIILRILNIASILVIVPFGIHGVYEWFMGPEDAEKLLKRLHIPLSNNRALAIGLTSIILKGITDMLLEKLAGTL